MFKCNQKKSWFFLLTTGILATKSTKASIPYFSSAKQVLWKKAAISPHWMFFKIRMVLVIASCGKKKYNVRFLVWCARVAVCNCLLVLSGRLLVVCGRFLVVCSSLLVVCSCLLIVWGGLWSFAVGLWWFVLVCGDLWSVLVVVCFSNYLLCSMYSYQLLLCNY